VGERHARRGIIRDCHRHRSFKLEVVIERLKARQTGDERTAVRQLCPRCSGLRFESRPDFRRRVVRRARRSMRRARSINHDVRRFGVGDESGDLVMVRRPLTPRQFEMLRDCIIFLAQSMSEDQVLELADDLHTVRRRRVGRDDHPTCRREGASFAA
jgi:hypothetical protein